MAFPPPVKDAERSVHVVATELAPTLRIWQMLVAPIVCPGSNRLNAAVSPGSCVIVTVWPPIVTVPLRAAPEFPATVTAMVPLPVVVVLGTVRNDELLLAAHEQVLAAVTVTVTVAQATTAGEQLISAFVSAYNDLVGFTQAQNTAANNNDQTSIGHDSVLRSVTSALQSAIGGSNSADSTYQYLSSVGIGFTQTGQLTFDQSAYQNAVAGSGLAHVQALFSASGATKGVFQNINNTISQYTGAVGFVTAAQTNDTNQIAALTKQISDFEARLQLQQSALQKEFSAADQAISAINNQLGSLSQLQGQFQLL